MSDEQVTVTNKYKKQQCILIGGKRCIYDTPVSISAIAWETFKASKCGAFYAKHFDAVSNSKKKTQNKKTQS